MTDSVQIQFDATGKNYQVVTMDHLGGVTLWGWRKVEPHGRYTINPKPTYAAGSSGMSGAAGLPGSPGSAGGAGGAGGSSSWSAGMIDNKELDAVLDAINSPAPIVPEVTPDKNSNAFDAETEHVRTW